jgi:hypothetical protein
VQRLVRGDDVQLGEAAAFDDLAADLQRHLGREELAGLVTEGDFLGRETQVHGIL